MGLVMDLLTVELARGALVMWLVGRTLVSERTTRERFIGMSAFQVPLAKRAAQSSTTPRYSVRPQWPNFAAPTL